MTKVKVGVRARPLTRSEIQSGDEIAVEVSENRLILTNQRVGTREWETKSQACSSASKGRHFSYDYCFLSVDPCHPKYASQESIYKNVGVPVLESLLEGYNGCIFAYGQSGTGKSYTITGTEHDEGLLPRLCTDLFVKNSQLLNCKSKIQVSFIELYKERVHDLLNFTGFSDNLRVREHPQSGPFVDGLKWHYVTSVDDVMRLIENSKSIYLQKEFAKRSHSIFTIRCLQETNHVENRYTTSELHLVDLAGSERSTLTGDIKDHQEIININKSLVTLGIVISSLANRLNSSLPHYFVPFRNSVLTWLLKETLGGNCVTCMIATISPASSCYKETLNTLRYAERAGNILNTPVVNKINKTQRDFLSDMKTEMEFARDRLGNSLFRNGILLENVICPYREVSFESPEASISRKPSDIFNPFINKEYFEKPPELFEANGPSLSAVNRPSYAISNSDRATSQSWPISTVLEAGDQREEELDGPSQPSDNNPNTNENSLYQSIEIKFRKRPRPLSKSCENLSVEVLPLWKRFSLSLQDRTRMESKAEDEPPGKIEPLPLSLLKIFKRTNSATSDDYFETGNESDPLGVVKSLEQLEGSDPDFRMIEEETDSMLGSWCSSVMSRSVKSDDCALSIDAVSPQSDDLVTPKTESTSNGDLNRSIPVENDNLVEVLIEPLKPTISPRRDVLSDSLCSSTTGSDVYNDSLNTPVNSPSRVDLNQSIQSSPGYDSINDASTTRRRRSAYSTDSVEGCNNVTSCESLTYEEVEKSRRTFINYVTTTIAPRYSTITDERKTPFTLIRDPGTPDSGFVSTRVFPSSGGNGGPCNAIWPVQSNQRDNNGGLQSSSSSDSITFVFVDQALSKNSRNNSEERSSAESTVAPEVNSVIELPSLVDGGRNSNGESIVTLDSLDVWKERSPGRDDRFHEPTSPRALSVDSLIMEQYLKMVNTTCPEGQAVRFKTTKNNPKPVITSTSTSESSTSSDNSKASVKRRGHYDKDLVKLMSNVVQLLKDNNGGGRQREIPQPNVPLCHKCNVPTIKYPGSTSSSYENSDSTSVYRRSSRVYRRKERVVVGTTPSSSDGGSDKTNLSEGSSSVDDEYRRILKDSLKKEIKLIRKERDQVYRLLQREKRKNSSTTRTFDKQGVKSEHVTEISKLEKSSVSSGTRSVSSSSSSKDGTLIKSQRADIPRTLSGPRYCRKKEVRRVELLEERQRRKPLHQDGPEDKHSSKVSKAADRSKTIDISRDLHDSGVMDCCSGIFHNTTYHGVDKGVQTLLPVNQGTQEEARPFQKMTSSPKRASTAVSSWHQPQLSPIKPKSFGRHTGRWKNDLDILDDLLGEDTYLELPDEFNHSESFYLPFPSRF